EAWIQGHPIYWAWLTTLFCVLGYGIGLYTFLALGWVIVFTGLGAFILACSPNVRARGCLWLIGASLQRLLPFAELSKGFKDFFDDPTSLSRRQCRYFAVHALVGWALGLFLLAAMAGITQKG